MKRKKFKKKENNIGKVVQKTVLTIAENIFLDAFFIIFLSLVLGGFFYHKYSVLIKKTDLEPFQNPFILEKTNYQRVISVWRKDEEMIKEADFKKYTNPFKNRLAPSHDEIIKSK